MPLSGRAGAEKALRLVTFLCILSSLTDALTFEKTFNFKILDDVIEHNHEVNEIEESHTVYEYKKNITKIKAEENSQEEIKKKTGFFSKDEDNALGMDALTIIWYLTTFTALFGFFIVMACTENSCQRRRMPKPPDARSSPPTPCPSYKKEWAPPSYDTVMKRLKDQKVFIVPVHDGDNNFFTNPNDTVTSPPPPTINQTSVDIEKNETR